MAYGFCVGKSIRVRDQPVNVGSIDYSCYPAICSLARRTDSFFLNRATNLFQNECYSAGELQMAQAQLLDLLPLALSNDERTLLHQFIAKVAYALRAEMPLNGVAD